MLNIVQSYTKEQYCIAALEGKFTLASIEVAAPALRELQARFPYLALDLAGVITFDSAAFQLLATLKKEAAKNEHKFKLINHSEAVIAVLELYGAVGLFRDKIILSGGLQAERFRYGLDEQVFS